jgi:hypothetical protein
MEPRSVIDQYRSKCIVIKVICADDDASTRALLKWSNTDYKSNNNTLNEPMAPISRGKNKGQLKTHNDRGQLPGYTPEPTFVADPNHRKKLVTGELYGLVTAKVKDRVTMTKMDATRLGKNFGYMIRNLKNILPDCYIDACKAVLDHHFDDHQMCGPWCPCKKMTEEQLQSSKRYYRNKMKDAALYAPRLGIPAGFRGGPGYPRRGISGVPRNSGYSARNISRDSTFRRNIYSGPRMRRIYAIFRNSPECTGFPE